MVLKIKVSRRNFLRKAASTPLAAKLAADAQIAELTGANGPNVTKQLALGAKVLGEMGAPIASNNYESEHEKAAKYLTLFGKLPDFVDQYLRNESQYVSALDPDIACKRSWSMCVKIATQRERNYQRLRKAHFEVGWTKKVKSAFIKTFGFDWPMW